MASKSALLVWGGWDGHQPKEVAELLQGELVRHGFAVEVSDTLDAYLDEEKLKSLDLIVPLWTMGAIKQEQLRPLLNAVKSGVGIGGVHGGMCDSFRNETEYQWMTGGQWVAHPGNDGVEYTVEIRDPDHFITQGSPAVLNIKSEQYYLHVDPAVRVLATTRFPVDGVDGPHLKNGTVDMPTVWTKYWGEGRVFYNALGHQANVVAQPDVLNLTVRGLLWAAHAEETR
ncbi:MAG: ThuA domain-containing protein [Akkermansiaceae bacterium]|nr:ThuA domain-containing protein [Armatimonadota bacterium]